MSEDQLRATHKGILHIANVDLRCFVLEDQRRVISGRSLTEAIGMKGRGQGAARISTHPALKAFIGADLALALENPIQFKSNNLPKTGFEATVLLEIRDAILNARDAGVLKTEHVLGKVLTCLK